MVKLLQLIIDKVPLWFLLTLLTLIIIWFGGLSYIAFFSNRSVVFFPPQIGPNKELVLELKALSQDVKLLNDTQFQQIKFLSEKLAESRKDAADATRTLSGGSYAYEANASKYEKEIKNIEEDVSLKLKSIMDKMSNIEKLID